MHARDERGSRKLARLDYESQHDRIVSARFSAQRLYVEKSDSFRYAPVIALRFRSVDRIDRSYLGRRREGAKDKQLGSLRRGFVRMEGAWSGLGCPYSAAAHE